LRVFLDTNVLVTAFATRGLCADLFRYVLVEHELLVGEFVLTELKRVLLNRIKVPPRTVADIERLLRDQEVVPKPRRHLDIGLRGADDEWIVASATAANADALVTGDADILEASTRMALRVYAPRAFWEHVRRTGSG
jgi:putative PIN family toxin of toxin-antitoxin system